MKSVRIGAGAGFSGDRIEPAIELAKSGNLDFLVFECLAERTIALSQVRKRNDPTSGYDPFLADRLRAVLPACRESGTRIISNMGAANPRAAAQKALEVARTIGLHGLRVACMEGDDVLHLKDTFTVFEKEPLPDPSTYVSANAYLGADTVAEALNRGADIVLTGRVADPSLFLGPLLHSFHWDIEAWDLLAQGTAIGHLLECAGQLTGGYFADPGYKDVPNLDRLGFPLAEVAEDGSAVLTKIEGSGGSISLQTCREQMLYEVLNPSSYVTPDVMADFTHIRFDPEGTDRMLVFGGRGKPRPGNYKVSIGVEDGIIAEAQISYAGPGALARAELARDVVEKRLVGSAAGDLRMDLIGLTSMHGSTIQSADLYEVRLRAAARFTSRQDANSLIREVESLYLNGPAGGAGVTFSVRENIAVVPALITRDAVVPTFWMEEA